MPRLGNGNEEEEPPPSRIGDGSIAQAYPSGSRNASLIQTMKGIIIAFSITLFLRNLVLKDYRTDELSVLKANGLSEDEINLYIPKTTAEKNKLRKQDIAKHTTDFDQLKMDVATLKEQIKLLEKKVGINESTVELGAAEDEVRSTPLLRVTKKTASSLLEEYPEVVETDDKKGSDSLEKIKTKADAIQKVETIDSVEVLDSMERTAMG